MRKNSVRWSVAAAALCVSPWALASSDGDDCVPKFNVYSAELTCNSLPYFAPGNDTRANLRLLLADAGRLPFQPLPPGKEEQSEGFDALPVPVWRLGAVSEDADSYFPSHAVTQDTETTDANDNNQQPIDQLARELGVDSAMPEPAGKAFLEGEGARCHSNDLPSAWLFLDAVKTTATLTAAERKNLAEQRLQLLSACKWEPGKFAVDTGASAAAQDFAKYLVAAADFYSERFSDAAEGFAQLANSQQPWLKSTALYLQARTTLNMAQQGLFDSEGFKKPDAQADVQLLATAKTQFAAYLQQYPEGAYAASARGLLRRLHWIGGESGQLANDYWAAFPIGDGALSQGQGSLLINEADQILLAGLKDAAQLDQPHLLFVETLRDMRSSSRTAPYSLPQLQALQAKFAAQPGLYSYLLATYYTYVAPNPEQALKALPEALPNDPDYLSFSQQTLRGLVLEQKTDWAGAIQLWTQLLAVAHRPLQQEQLQLALALDYQRAGELAKVFAKDSPVHLPNLRLALLTQVAGADVLRQQAQNSTSADEHQAALYTLLLKDLTRNRYVDFRQDLALLPSATEATAQASAVQTKYPLTQFQNVTDSKITYSCPSIDAVAEQLQQDPHQPQGLICLGEFIANNHLGWKLYGALDDSFGGALGAGGDFAGKIFTQQKAYREVLDSPKAVADEKAYALYRLVNCYGPSGNNSCGDSEVDPAQRKKWFQQLKTQYAKTQWAQQQKYFW